MSRSLRRLLPVTCFLVLAACSAKTSPLAAPESPLAKSDFALFVNGGFDAGLSGWTVNTNLNYGITYPPQNVGNLNLAAGGTNLTSVTAGPTLSLVPAGLTAGSTLRVPRYGTDVAVVNKQGSSYNVNSLHQQVTTSAADVDPSDGNIHVRFALAPVLQNPGHPLAQQPYFYVVITNITQNKVLFSTFNYSNQPGVPWKTDPSNGNLYTDWQAFDVAPGPVGLAIGDTVEMRVIAAGCAAGGHFGEIYVDAFGAFLPGVSVVATAPASANKGSVLTYTVTAKNADPNPDTNTTVSFVLPAQTTFSSVNAPGASCTTPAAGAAGTVVCNLGTLNPTASSSFTIAVNVASNATGTINAGNYSVTSDQGAPLLGPLVVTNVTQNISYADLTISVTDGQAAVAWGQSDAYTLVVQNNGPTDVVGALVTDTFPAFFQGVTWTCAPSGAAVCPNSSGSGNISETPSMPSGTSVTYVASGTVAGGSGNGTLTDTASVAAPSGITDNVPGNNIAVHTDSIGTLYAYTASKDPGNTGDGTLISSPAAINCGAGCTQAQANFIGGTLVSLTATAAPGSVFAGWTGGCTGTTNPCNLTVSGATQVTALFNGTTVAVTGQVAGGQGTITCQSPVTLGNSSTCTLQPAAGYALVQLVDNGTDVTSHVSGGAYVINPVNVAHIVAATFAKTNGIGCTATAECASGQCTDGVCCDTACGGQCQACDVAGSVGTCTPVSGSPHAGRAACASDGSSCGGTCDGTNVNSCAYPTSSCSAASCVAGVETLSASCDGAGSCPAGQLVGCGVYVCGATFCLVACGSDGDCASGNYCVAGACIPQLGGGSTCTADDQCGTGHCTDGLCCDTACNGQCEACDVSGSEGTCSPVEGGPHGSRTACLSDGSLCGGFCGGAVRTACNYPASACRAASCSADTATLAAFCDGAGNCPAVQTQSCGNYVCGSSACVGNCSSDGDCQAGNWCSGGVCIGQLGNGTSCGGGDQCSSGNCVDGVCCDTACNGQCEACDVTGSAGTCSAATGVPHGSRAACNDDGTGCGGACDGSQRAVCGYPGNSVSCRAASCSVGVSTLAASCNGAGACPPVQTQACGVFLCGPSACLGNCTSDSDCVSQHYCSAGVCVPKGTLGQSCTATDQCGTGNCVDGVCCDTACNGQCEACDVAGGVGTCSPASGAPHGGRASCASDGSACGGACDGNQRSLCAYPGASTSCRAASCQDATATLAAVCNGTGLCPARQTQGCGQFSCGGADCLGGCTSDADCMAGDFCSGGVCKARLGPGEHCGSADMCASSLCVDGVCCNSACGGQCQACDVPGHLGACTPVSGTPHAGRPVCTSDGSQCGGTCDGQNTDICSFPGSATQCRAESCAAGQQTASATCDGQGHCPSAQTQSCGAYACGQVACMSSCGQDSDCASSMYCAGGQCVAMGSPGHWKAAGSGGCSTGPGLAPLALLASMLLLLRRRVRRATVPGVALLVLALAPSARAEDVSTALVLQRFQPMGGSADMLGVESAQVAGTYAYSVGAFANFGEAPLRLVPDAPGSSPQTLMRNQTTLDLVGSIGWGHGFELSAALPLTVSQQSTAAPQVSDALASPLAGSGVGDLRIAPKLHLWERAGFAVAVAAPITLPTGNSAALLGNGLLSVAPRAIGEYVFVNGARVTANLGVLIQPQRQLVNIEVGPALTFSAGGELPFNLGGQRFRALATVAGEADELKGGASLPMEALLALTWVSPVRGLEATLGGGPGLTSGFGTPQYRLFAAVAWRL